MSLARGQTWPLQLLYFTIQLWLGNGRVPSCGHRWNRGHVETRGQKRFYAASFYWCNIFFKEVSGCNQRRRVFEIGTTTIGRIKCIWNDGCSNVRVCLHFEHLDGSPFFFVTMQLNSEFIAQYLEKDFLCFGYPYIYTLNVCYILCSMKCKFSARLA